jgi:hypothetical protein
MIARKKSNWLHTTRAPKVTNIDVRVAKIVDHRIADEAWPVRFQRSVRVPVLVLAGLSAPVSTGPCGLLPLEVGVVEIEGEFKRVAADQFSR